MMLPKRKHPRLKNYDYSQCGCYHIAICTKKRKPILGQVCAADSPYERAWVKLTPCGAAVKQYIERIDAVYDGVQLAKYEIMPNHVHMLLVLETGASTSIPTIVRSVKRMANRELGQSIWQESFYDVIIRNDTMFQCEWIYIDNNPDKWAEDELFVDMV